MFPPFPPAPPATPLPPLSPVMAGHPVSGKQMEGGLRNNGLVMFPIVMTVALLVL